MIQHLVSDPRLACRDLSKILTETLTAASRPAVALGLALTLAGCGLPGSRQQRYAGTLAGCGGGLPATLVRVQDTFAFTPGDGALLLRGTIAADGTLAATLDTQPPGKPPYELAVRGRIDAAAATLRYATPTCTASGTLAHVPEELLP